ncbi:FAD/NAD(P)-binding protein [Streptomyces griseus]|uniref:FAD/NAD(P)-binding protein n=1 Tax=Streptomyces griseus TaxID=1911 RepID=UPI003796CA69
MPNDSARPFTGQETDEGRTVGDPASASSTAASASASASTAASASAPADEGVTRIGVVGAGPRGISVVERLCANAGLPYARERRYAVHLVDPFPDGGQVWRTGQRAELLMNTVASQITLYCDESVDCAGPVVPGPSLHQWAALLEELGSGGLPADVRREAAALGPDAYPTRRLYGHYLMWVLDRLRRGAPPNLTITVHHATAVALRDAPGGRRTQVVTLDRGGELAELDAVVLAQGHVPVEPTARQREFGRYARRNGLLYFPPANPADVDFAAIGAGQPTGLVGMGLTFFDVVALLTGGRGGVFERDGGGALVYRPSGLEPVLYAGSRRGVPYHARGENEKGVSGRHEPLFLTPSVIEELRERHRSTGTLSFNEHVWPLVSREVRAVYYRALLTERGEAAAGAVFCAEFVARGGPEGAEEAALLDRHGIPAERRWSWPLIERPYGEREFADRWVFQGWLLGHLREDVAEALKGNVSSPLKAALDVLRDLRNEIRLVVDHAGISGRSYRDELRAWYTPLNAYLSIGPPARRIEELIALIEAGVVRMCLPGVRAEPEPEQGGFVLRSAGAPASGVRVSALIEARLSEPDLRSTTDPLLRSLLRSGQCAPYRIPDGAGGFHETGGVAVSRRPYHLLDAARRPHPRRFAFGVPTESVHWVTAAGVRPGVNSVILGDSDAIARRCLAAVRPAAAAPARHDAPLRRHIPLPWLPTSCPPAAVPAPTAQGAS